MAFQGRPAFGFETSKREVRSSKETGSGWTTSAKRETSRRVFAKLKEMIRDLITYVRFASMLAVVWLMLMPTGICICADHDDESPNGQHEPGCPKVRKLDRMATAEHYSGDLTSVSMSPIARVNRLDAGPIDPVTRTGHGPPRGRPTYLTLQTLLI